MRDQTFMTLMRLLPKSALSAAVGAATRVPAPPRLHHLAMRAFARRYQVELEEAELPLEGYPTFAQFFTRRLKAGARAIDSDPRALISPVDGRVSQVGHAERGECIQAKGIRFPLEKLLGDPAEAARFEGGAFATLYLSPRDYHRFHSPLDGAVEGYTYIPGEFWPVNQASVRLKDALFCINERLVTYLSTAAGRIAYVAVGATCVARIRASYDDVVTHSGGQAKVQRYERAIPVKKGDELGMFEMGSTVIMVCEPGRVRWADGLGEGAPVRLGQRIGEMT